MRVLPPLPPLVHPDMHAETPWPVAVALGQIGLRCFGLWGVRQRFTPAGTELVCECAPGGGCDCKKGQTGKHPRLAGWQERASADPLVLSLFAKRWPRANVGVLTGEGVVVVDVDGEQGLKSLHTVQHELGALPETVRSRSGRLGPGYHLWFALRPGEPVPRNSASTLGSGIDVRGSGGFVVAPGSLHKSGRRYAWELGPDQINFAYLPDRWLSAMTLRAKPRLRGGGDGRPNVRSFRRPEHEQGSRLVGDGPGRGGFDRPLYANACAFLHRWPQAPDEVLINALRSAVEAAPKGEGRDVRRYLSDAYLRERVRAARAFIEGSRE